MLSSSTRWLATAGLGGLGAVSAGPAWAVMAGVEHTPAAVGVVIDQDAFSPDPVSAFVGDTITWTNADDIPHDVYGASAPSPFRSPMLSEGESWSYTALEPGEFAYVCTIHEGMVGSITILPHDDSEAEVSATVPSDTSPDTSSETTVAPEAEATAPEPSDEAAVAAPAVTVPAVAVAPATTPVAATVSEPSFRLDLRLLGAALLTFALIAMAFRVLSPERDG